MTETRPHPRIMLCLPVGTYSLAPIEIASDIARWIGSNLETMVSADDISDARDAMPFAREFQPLFQRWKNWDSEQVSSDRHLLQRKFRREAEKIANASGVSSLFQTVSDELAVRLGELGRDTDIIAFPAPRLSGEELVGSYPQLLACVSSISRSILILPQAPVRRKGPILAVLSKDDMILRRLAEQIARAASEDLIIIDADQDRDRQARPGSVHPSRRLPVHFTDSQETHRLPLAGVRDLGERLVLMSRQSCQDLTEADFLKVVATRRVPLLIAT
ncbi:hypothetical protein PY365_23910 [Roseiarcaceae bacterium H3SJ34-1]|uniref:hypothetical protein n=1 Tax=Terripilifer ovatus TaxID=3032367 RepID=UPI003AB972B1|nr:hypothetical protein [Roseiarcaceae bacterium H3SJ34-1]